MSKCGCNKRVPEAGKSCPLCHKESDFINHLVVKSVVKEEVRGLVVDEKYYTCKNQDCEVVFFNWEGETIFLLQEIDLTADFDGVTKIKKPSCGGCSSNCGS